MQRLNNIVVVAFLAVTLFSFVSLSLDPDQVGSTEQTSQV